MYNDEFELTFDLADAGPKTEQRRPTLPEPEEAAAAAPPVQETRETPVSAAPENTPASGPEREPEPAAEPQSTAPAAKGRTVLISGGDRGIGAAAARAFYAAGCRVAVFYHTNAEAAAALQKELPGVLAVQCDVASRASCELAFRAAEQALGRVDVLVNNAGIGSVSLPFEEITDEDWDRMLRVDLTAPFYLCREVIPYMKARKHGKIINISSGSGIIGCEFCSHYASAKAGLIGFTQSIAKELGGDHINANAIAVPTTQTPMLKETDFDIFVEDELRDIPWGRIGTPEDIADMVLYLASDASEYVTGQVLAPNGGRRTPV